MASQPLYIDGKAVFTPGGEQVYTNADGTCVKCCNTCYIPLKCLDDTPAMFGIKSIDIDPTSLPVYFELTAVPGTRYYIPADATTAPCPATVYAIADLKFYATCAAPRCNNCGQCCYSCDSFVSFDKPSVTDLYHPEYDPYWAAYAAVDTTGMRQTFFPQDPDHPVCDGTPPTWIGDPGMGENRVFTWYTEGDPFTGPDGYLHVWGINVSIDCEDGFRVVGGNYWQYNSALYTSYDGGTTWHHDAGADGPTYRGDSPAVGSTCCEVSYPAVPECAVFGTTLALGTASAQILNNYCCQNPPDCDIEALLSCDSTECLGDESP